MPEDLGHTQYHDEPTDTLLDGRTPEQLAERVLGDRGVPKQRGQIREELMDVFELSLALRLRRLCVWKRWERWRVDAQGWGWHG